MIEKRYYEFDGTKNGIIVSFGENDKFITNPDKVTPRVFNNLEVAKIMSKYIIPNATKFKYYVQVDDITTNIDNCQHIGNDWQFFYNNMIIIGREKRLYRTINIGYICFENGESVRCEKEYGQKRQHELLKIIREACQNILCENYECSIIEINSKYKELVLHIKGTTSKIHILYNSKLMDINQSRKAEALRCFQFAKEMDKYTTFYVYSDRDSSESHKIDAEGKSNNILNSIIEYLKYFYADINPKYISIEQKGFLELED